MYSRISGASILVKATFAIWLISTVFIMVLLNKLDGVVHGDLYNYGLQFSLSWATPYWAFLRLIYICLALPSTLSLIVLGLGFVKKPSRSRAASTNGVKPCNGQVQTSKENNMIISCPNCHRMFSKPLTMLDFGTGKAELVNVCPYCSHILNRADEKERDDVHVLEPEKKEVQPNPLGSDEKPQ